MFCSLMSGKFSSSQKIVGNNMQIISIVSKLRNVSTDNYDRSESAGMWCSTEVHGHVDIGRFDGHWQRPPSSFCPFYCDFGAKSWDQHKVSQLKILSLHPCGCDTLSIHIKRGWPAIYIQANLLYFCQIFIKKRWIVHKLEPRHKLLGSHCCIKSRKVVWWEEVLQDWG